MSRRSKVDAQLRARRAVQLKLAGKTFQEVADTEMDGAKLYGSAGAAHDAIMRVLNGEQEEYGRNVEELRTQELSRLDALYQTAFVKAMKGDEKFINVCLRIMDQRRKYIGGLEVPAKQEVSGPDGAAPFSVHLAWPMPSPDTEVIDEEDLGK